MFEIEISYSKIGQHFDNKRYWCFFHDDIEKYNDRPRSKLGSDNFLVLNDILHYWLLEHHMDYSIKEIGLNTCIIFENKEDAVLFKLVWM